MAERIIRCGENPQDITGVLVPDQIGGKAANLLRLYSLSKQSGDFYVPDFFIIPTNYDWRTAKAEFDKLKKPIIVRSSSPFEDSENASFAGMFTSIPDVNNFDRFVQACSEVKDSANKEEAKIYAKKRNVKYREDMAFIVQEQVVNPWIRGVIQLEEDIAVMEYYDRKGNFVSHDSEYSFLDEHEPWKPFLEPHDWIAEGEHCNAIQRARAAKKALGLDGMVQVEFCLSPSQVPAFVQIRQLPRVNQVLDALDLTIPEGVPYMETTMCNDVRGELILPTYSTLSQSALGTLLRLWGQASFVGRVVDETVDYERMAEFTEKTKLAHNPDLAAFRNVILSQRLGMMSKREELDEFFKTWQAGNSLFPEYILVCDKLDETLKSMNLATSNKKAIITCLESERTSHAMTVARELGIMCMGLDRRKNMDDVLDDFNSFFYQVETGDLVHMKSDGRRAVVYIERKRERNPYINTK